jgi:cytochrome P450
LILAHRFNTVKPFGVSDEYVIPAGVVMLIIINHVHRNPDQFPNPENFDPYYFLPERVAIPTSPSVLVPGTA